MHDKNTPNDEKKLSEEEKRSLQLTITADARTAIGHESWTVFSIFFAANAVLLNALFQSTDPPFIRLKWFVVPIAGILLSYIWYRIQDRFNDWNGFYESIVNDLEMELKTDKNYRTGKDNPKIHEKVPGPGIRQLLVQITIGMMVGWGIMLGVGVWMVTRLIQR